MDMVIEGVGYETLKQEHAIELYKLFLETNGVDWNKEIENCVGENLERQWGRFEKMGGTIDLRCEGAKRLQLCSQGDAIRMYTLLERGETMNREQEEIFMHRVEEYFSSERAN